MKTRLTTRRWHLGAALAFAAVLLTACGSSGSSGAKPESGPGSSAATVATRTGALGSHLTDGSGRTLYLFVNDTAGRSVCNGSCATIWSPLTTTGTPRAGSGADASKLGTTIRDDGSTQVTYNGHPLYYFKEDSAAGDTNGQGVNGSGGLWWVVSPAGDPIEGAAPSGNGTGGGNGGRGGYGGSGW